MPVYAGCVYHKPPPRFAPQGVEDLSAHSLKNMTLVGIPIKESHENRTIGRVTDEWQSSDGSKHVAFSIDDTDDTVVQRTGIASGVLGHLSLSHRVGSPPEPLEVSVCSKVS